MGIEVRDARADDDAALARIDVLTWTSAGSPAPPPAPGTPFFSDRTRPDDVLVAEVDGAVAGYVALGDTLPIPAHRHVREIRGLAVDPGLGRRGVGRALVLAAVDRAARAGAVKVGLRVLGPNTGARRLYARCGFGIEGVLRGEFRIDGVLVDDVLMATFPGGEPPRPAARSAAPPGQRPESSSWERADRLDETRRRLRTLEALAAALRRPADVAAAVTAAPDRPTAAAALQELLGVAADEAHAVLQMQWGRLTGDTLPRIEEDVRELRADLRDLGDDR
ncbi:GNAT family N-acetyltransferase [Pseudonocardia benzenivorans]|uniref:GCN5-related N-acetyltransferase n=2 Tax=Pseudonocardia TaxID=1847 RepID=F4CVB3_PSEUX|nr:GNAT family N-acetyltransferase [Pseudonocardia dioxanivorans]AEA23177.1 GCN5-related N-acetyltransferase [Pseudonocardia dioxanivorans CB1190]